MLSKYELEIKKSKFIGLLYDVKNIDEVTNILDNLHKEHPKARHMPYAYIIGSNMKKTDDKEPHNTAGMQIYNQLMYHNLDHHLLVVIRYFGGVKLGSGPLLRAYLNTAVETINQSNI